MPRRIRCKIKPGSIGMIKMDVRVSALKLNDQKHEN